MNAREKQLLQNRLAVLKKERVNELCKKKSDRTKKLVTIQTQINTIKQWMK